MEQFKNQIANLIASSTNLSQEEIISEIEIPPDRSLGDFAFPCFKLAKVLKKNPAQIAQELAETLQSDEYFSEINAKGPYLNFTCNFVKFAGDSLGEILRLGERYGEDDEGEGKTVVIDFSSPNIAKPFGFGHLRSTVIGNSLANIYARLGYQVERINHLGDWGTQFGNLIAAYLRWGDQGELEQNPIEYLYQLYVKFHDESEQNEELEQEGRKWFRRLEEGDETALELWQQFKDLSLQEFQRVYKMLGVNFDSYKGEAFYNDKLEDTVEKIKDSGIATYSQGALIVDLSAENLPPCLVKKQDGATLYITRDLSAAIYRYHTYQFDKALYVVGKDQELHFNQIYNVLNKMGYDWASQIEHVPFGLIRFQDQKMSTRKGNLVFLEDVLDKSKSLALDIINEKNPGLKNKEQVAEMVGIGAVVFGDLSNDRVKEINFDWDKILDFNGETGPYLQYTHARICSILRKAEDEDTLQDKLEEMVDDKVFIQALEGEYERNVVHLLSSFSESIKRAKEFNKPHVLSRYLLDLAREFNRFYNNCPILTEQDEVKWGRLLLINSVRQVLVNGLAIMGIQAPKEM